MSVKKMKIDCAKNSNLAEELVDFLQEKAYSVSQEEGLVTTNEKISPSILELFLDKTDRSKHKITFVDTDTYLIAIPMDLEDIGLESCEFCGYTAHHEDIQVHRRSHQAL